MVRSEDVIKIAPFNDLGKGAEIMVALKRNGYFDQRPHLTLPIGCCLLALTPLYAGAEKVRAKLDGLFEVVVNRLIMCTGRVAALASRPAFQRGLECR